MDASPLLKAIIRALHSSRLEAVLLGNAAAAIHGAPVTTLDFDFMFRDTPVNRRKLKEFASELDAMILRPYYPLSALFRVVNEDRGIQVDFMPHAHGIKSFSSLRSRAENVTVGKDWLLVASLDDIIRSKKAAGRARDKAVMEILIKTNEAIKKEKA